MLKVVKLSGDFSWEVLKLVRMSGDFSRKVLKFVKFSSQKTKCFGHGRRIMFLLPGVFEGGFQTCCKLQGTNRFS